jgi:hypothetical protein
VLACAINSLAEIIKRACPTTRYVFDRRREPFRALDGEKTMESFVNGTCNLIGFWSLLGCMFGIYLAPFIIAVVRVHHRLPWIGLLNFAVGWTVVGWIFALVWSVTATRQPVGIPRISSTAAFRTAQPAAA